MAGEEWIECNLADACSSIDYGFTASASDIEAGPQFLRITDIVAGHIDWKTVPHVVADTETIKKFRIDDGDIVLARTGASTGASIYIKSPPQAVFASYLIRLKAKPEFDSRFLAYYLKSDAFWSFIRGVLGDKSAQPNASASTMTQAPLRAPKNKDLQRAIAYILGTLDDKIELNRRMNETLEEIARGIFKSWFVDFDPVRAKAEGRDPDLPKHIAEFFPDSFEDSELGSIPKGWEARKLGDLLEFAYGKALKAEDRREGNVPVYGSNGPVGWHDEPLATGPGIIVGRKGNPGIATWAPTDFFAIDTAFYVVPKQVCCSLHFLFHVLQTHNLASLGADSAVPGLNRNLAYMSAQVLPPAQLLLKFEDYMHNLSVRVQRNNEESRTLAALRDALLPKLISGELRIKYAERFIGEVTS